MLSANLLDCVFLAYLFQSKIIALKDDNIVNVTTFVS